MINLTKIRLEHRTWMLTFLPRISLSNDSAKIIGTMTIKCFFILTCLLCVSANAQKTNNVNINDVETIPEILKQSPKLAEKENVQPEAVNPTTDLNYGKSKNLEGSKSLRIVFNKALSLLCNTTQLIKEVFRMLSLLFS